MKKLIIDNEFKKLIPPLTNDEYKKLEDNIILDGCREPLVVWNNIIVDGHNRYKICTKHNLPFKTEEREFKDRDEVMEWMLKNQLGRRNLNDFQRAEVAMRYEDVIKRRMKERQLEGNSKGGQVTKDKFMAISTETKETLEPQGVAGVDRVKKTEEKRTTTRAELAKIAGTSEYTIRNTKKILEHGTEEQKERARKGEESPTAIAAEIDKKLYPKKTKICSVCGRELPITEFYSSSGKCKSCHLAKNKERKFYTDIAGDYHKPENVKHYSEEEVIGNLYDVDAVVEITISDLTDEFKGNANNFLTILDGIIQRGTDVLKDNSNRANMKIEIQRFVDRIKEIEGRF